MTVQLVKKINIDLLAYWLLFLVYFIHFIYIYANGYIKVFPYSDAQFYLDWIRQVLHGRVAVPFLGLPGYPFLMSIFFRIISKVSFLILIQHLFSAIAGVFLYKVVDRLTGNKLCALLSVVLYLGYTPFMMYSSILTPESLAIFLLSVWFYLFLKDSFDLKDALLSGLLGGVIVIIRPAFCLWFLSLSVFIPVRFVINKVNKLFFAILYFVSLLLPIFIVMQINHKYTGFWQLTAHEGINFYIGNSNIASGLFYTGGIFRPTQSGMIEDARIIASKIEGHSLSVSQASRFWRNKAFEFIIRNPSRFLLLIVKKFFLLFNATEYHDANWRAMKVPILPFINFSFIFPLSFIALWTTRKNPVVGVLRLCFVLTSMAVILVFVNTRYKLMVVFPSIVLAGIAVNDLYLLIKKRRLFEVVTLLIVAAIFFVVGGICWVPVVRDNVAIRFNKAVELIENKEFDKAETILKQLVAENAGDYLSWFTLGNIYYNEGKLDKARLCYIKSLSINGWFADALFNLGVVLLKQKKFDKAERCFSQLYQVSPQKLDVIYNLIVTKVALNKCKEAHILTKQLFKLYPQLGNFELKEIDKVLSRCRK